MIVLVPSRLYVILAENAGVDSAVSESVSEEVASDLL